MGFPDTAAKAKHGDFLPDQIRPITGQIGYVYGSSSGAIYEGGSTGASTHVLESTLKTLNSARLGPRYSGDISHGPLIIYTPLIRVR
ncbi:hypothetical protein KL86DPRO_11495 [uncultured delta proteobacterium]|uniref:Uncharacterized protein n=1 Tax=uncultured delta proteobacterium TaxID=34034 RepID=A0A212JHY7_9DELT|nr:hypothetical protein KL86DPRO_11495 [uncultured delta proteobacterium]